MLDLRKIKNKLSLPATNIKGRILSRSLLWMGLGLVVIILVAWLTSTFEIFRNMMINLSTGSIWSISWLLNVALMFAMFFTINNQKIHIIFPTILYIFFAFYEGIFVSSILFFTNMENELSSLLLYMLIPAGIFVIMGFVSYFNLIDFSRLLPFTFFAFVCLLIITLVFAFTNSAIVEKWYLVLSMLIFLIWIGFDLQMIQKTEEWMDGSQINKKELNRMSFIFGIRLFIDFINLLIIFLRLKN